MDQEVQHKLETLRSDYREVTGKSFSHFYCPILFRDQDAALCRAHIVNSAFPDSCRKWTVQRADLDSFYGSAFESDFVDLQYGGRHLTDDAIIDPLLSKKLRPKVYIGEKKVEHFIASGPVPAHFTEVHVNGPDGSVRLGLKIRPDETLSTADWRIAIEKDVRLAALVSMLKAAHLTLFEMLGYRYALSAGGHFLGHDILGEFFLANLRSRQGRDNRKWAVSFSGVRKHDAPSAESSTRSQRDSCRSVRICVPVRRWHSLGPHRVYQNIPSGTQRVGSSTGV